MSVLEAISVIAYPRSSREEMLADWDDTTVQACLGWEWGDAGNVLRFRSLHRDVWRASLLPSDVVERTDGWVKPYLTPEATSEEWMSIPVDPYEVLWVAGQVDTSQARYGAYLCYGDPADRDDRWAASLRQSAFGNVSYRPIYRLLSTITPEQWELARGDGVRLGYDLSSGQQALARESLATLVRRHRLERELSDYTMRVRPGNPETIRHLGTSDRYDWHLEFVAKGEVVAEQAIMNRLYGYVIKTGREKTREAAVAVEGE